MSFHYAYLRKGEYVMCIELCPDRSVLEQINEALDTDDEDGVE